MNIEVLTALVIFAFAASITPGPNNIMLLASGTNHGFRRSIPHMLGVAIGFGVMVVLVGLGLVQVFDILPMSYTVLKYTSISYLMYLSWNHSGNPAVSLGPVAALC